MSGFEYGYNYLCVRTGTDTVYKALNAMVLRTGKFWVASAEIIFDIGCRDSRLIGLEFKANFAFVSDKSADLV